MENRLGDTVHLQPSDSATASLGCSSLVPCLES